MGWTALASLAPYYPLYALFFLSTDLSAHITGQTFAVDGGDLVAYPNPITGASHPPGRAMGEEELGAPA